MMGTISFTVRVKLVNAVIDKTWCSEVVVVYYVKYYIKLMR